MNIVQTIFIAAGYFACIRIGMLVLSDPRISDTLRAFICALIIVAARQIIAYFYSKYQKPAPRRESKE